MISNSFVYLHVVSVVIDVVESFFTFIAIVTKLPSVKLHVTPQVIFVGKCLVAFVARRPIVLIQLLHRLLGIYNVNNHLE